MPKIVYAECRTCAYGVQPPYWQADEVQVQACLLYTSDAADDLLCVDLGGRRIIKKKTTEPIHQPRM